MASNYKGLYMIFYKMSVELVKSEIIQQKCLTLLHTRVFTRIQKSRLNQVKSVK